MCDLLVLISRHATEKHAKPDSHSQHVQCSQYSLPGFPYQPIFPRPFLLANYILPPEQPEL